MTSNLKPVDEFFSVREKIKELKVREDELKQLISDLSPEERVGDFALVSISERKSKRFNRKAAEQELGDLSRFETSSISKVFRAEPLENPDAA